MKSAVLFTAAIAAVSVCAAPFSGRESITVDGGWTMGLEGALSLSGNER